MKASEIRNHSESELAKLEGDLRSQYFKLVMARAAQQPFKLGEFRRIRKDIARIKTILTQRASVKIAGQS